MSLFATLVRLAIQVKLLQCFLFTTRCQNVAMVFTITTIMSSIETHVSLETNAVVTPKTLLCYNVLQIHYTDLSLYSRFKLILYKSFCVSGMQHALVCMIL